MTEPFFDQVRALDTISANLTTQIASELLTLSSSEKTMTMLARASLALSFVPLASCASAPIILSTTPAQPHPTPFLCDKAPDAVGCPSNDAEPNLR